MHSVLFSPCVPDGKGECAQTSEVLGEGFGQCPPRDRSTGSTSSSYRASSSPHSLCQSASGLPLFAVRTADRMKRLGNAKHCRREVAAARSDRVQYLQCGHAHFAAVHSYSHVSPPQLSENHRLQGMATERFLQRALGWT